LSPVYSGRKDWLSWLRGIGAGKWHILCLKQGRRERHNPTAADSATHGGGRFWYVFMVVGNKHGLDGAGL
jgi:hypothetical protein